MPSPILILQTEVMTDTLVVIFNIATAVALCVIIIQLAFIVSLFALDIFIKEEAYLKGTKRA